ncbi:hypothetical protein [Paenibacillus glacialis]|uniref:GIY-YIG domain-containing protein n=1 Tax=Paenibacillus glacialis TaxID=494026 RepID=A0A168NP99_9BACL|nr:hypothetical protein [Paenibacillus glacialis]OAB45992.1 hypothetical protein PGLA_00925 [Paenibacillus glacialis]
MLNNLSLDFNWSKVETDEIPYLYPQTFDRSMNKNLQVPSVYRWRIYKTDSECRDVYIGETDNLKRRVTGYLKPGISQMTNIRMKNLFDNYIEKGYKIELDIVQISTFIFNGIELNQDSLSSKNIRLIIENMIILKHKNLGYNLLNVKI